VSEESTTPDLVELVRRSLEAANRRDYDAMLSIYAPEATWEVSTIGTSLKGVVAIRGFMDDWLSSYDEWEVEPEEVIDLGHEVSFGVFLQQGRPVGSTEHVQYRFAQVATWADGVIVSVTGYNDIGEARAAAERLAQEREERG